MEYRDFERLIEAAIFRKKTNPNLRLGQAFFQCIEDNFPKIADKIRGTKEDPYQADSVEDIFDTIQGLICGG